MSQAMPGKLPEEMTCKLRPRGDSLHALKESSLRMGEQGRQRLDYEGPRKSAPKAGLLIRRQAGS